MKDIFNNKFTDQVSLTNDFLVPDVSNYLQINETEIEASAKKIIKSARSYNSYNAFEKLMHEYALSSSEGIVLMCLAEALLRIPDNKTINDLIEDKIPTGQWKEHIKNDNNIFVNISSIAFIMTGKILKQGELKVELLGRGFAWLDTGTYSNMNIASKFVETIEDMQGLKIACLEEIAFTNGWIDKKQLKDAVKKYENSSYGNYLSKVLKSV